MPATTIKLEADLYAKVGNLKAPNQSTTAFVRMLIEQAHSQRQQAQAAATYRQFLDTHPEERAALEVWEGAPLGEPPEGPVNP